MGLTYDGITYRSLEEQVRYDAEQVQALKQADVTINENLQTINTEINGKLTKPTNPSAESAVTMLADGTVGTKPLSEIGGGGKMYEHRLSITYDTSNFYHIYITLISSSYTEITSPDILNSIKYVTISGYDTGPNYGYGIYDIAKFGGQANTYFISYLVTDSNKNTLEYMRHNITGTTTDTVMEL